MPACTHASLTTASLIACRLLLNACSCTTLPRCGDAALVGAGTAGAGGGGAQGGCAGSSPGGGAPGAVLPGGRGCPPVPGEALMAACSGLMPAFCLPVHEVQGRGCFLCMGGFLMRQCACLCRRRSAGSRSHMHADQLRRKSGETLWQQDLCSSAASLSLHRCPLWDRFCSS